jgi:hypothetical protein
LISCFQSGKRVAELTDVLNALFVPSLMGASNEPVHTAQFTRAGARSPIETMRVPFF